MRWHHLLRTASGALIAAAVPAAAQVTISTAQTTAVTTSTAGANNTPSDVTIAAGGSVTVTSGAAVTIDSPNAVTNSGTIANSGITNAFGVVITDPGSKPFTFTNGGPITLAGVLGSGDIGLWVTGTGTTGTISSAVGGSIAVAADNAYGALIAAPFTGSIGLRSVSVTGATSTIVALTAPLTGSLSIAGTNSATTSGSTGVLIAAPVTGAVSNEGSITVGTARGVSQTTGLLVAGNIGTGGVAIQSSVGGGFVNDRYYVDTTGATVAPAAVTTTDTLVTGTIVTYGGARALSVGPSAANPQAVTLGAVGTGTDAFGIVNRGVIEASIADVGQTAVAVQVGGGSVATTVAGGISNQSTATILSNSLDSSATGIDLLAGATVPKLENDGSITSASTAAASTSTTPVGPGGPAYGVVVEPGATLTTIVNTGTIQAISVGNNNNAIAILDHAGTVSSVQNYGTISASIAPLSGGAARAIDLSGGYGPVTLANYGTIVGDVVLGNGPTNVTMSGSLVNGVATGGSISGALVFGTSPYNVLALSGTASFGNTLTTGAPIAVTLADSSQLSLVNGPATLASIAASGSSALVIPVKTAAAGTTPAAALTVTGGANFTGASTIVLSLQSLQPSQTVTIINAAGGFATDHLATLVDGSVSPYLFTASPAVATADTLSIGLTRKTAAQIGLTGGQAALFDASIGALPGGSAEAAAIANLPNAASVAAAYRQITPPSFGRGQLRIAQDITDTGFGAASDRLAILIDRGRSRANEDDYGIGLWAQEYGDFNRQSGPNEGTFTTSTFGIAGGIDTTRLAHTVIGLGFVSNFATIRHDPVSTESGFNVPSTTTGVEPYVAFTFKPFYVEATALYAHVGYSANRVVTIGNITDTVVSNWSGTQFGAGINVGARLQIGKHFLITPSNALSWTSLREDGYTETGAGNFALAVARQTDTATSDTAKLAFAVLHPMGDGLLKFEVHGAYTHQFNITPTGTVANFVSGNAAISLPGDTVRANEFSYGADLGYTQDTVAFRGGYDRRDATGFHDQSVAVTATIGF